MIFIGNEVSYKRVLEDVLGVCPHTMFTKLEGNGKQCGVCKEVLTDSYSQEFIDFFNAMKGDLLGSKTTDKLLCFLMKFGRVEINPYGKKYVLSLQTDKISENTINLYSGKRNFSSCIAYLSLVLFEYLLSEGKTKEEIRRIINE